MQKEDIRRFFVKGSLFSIWGHFQSPSIVKKNGFSKSRHLQRMLLVKRRNHLFCGRLLQETEYMISLFGSRILEISQDGVQILTAYVNVLRQYCLRKLLGPCKSGMGRGLWPPRPVASCVERIPAARPPFSIGRAPGSISRSAR